MVYSNYILNISNGLNYRFVYFFHQDAKIV